MKIQQSCWTSENGWITGPPRDMGVSPQLVFVFGATRLLQEQKHFATLKHAYPQAHILGCSTAGEIYDTQVFDDSLSITAVHFEHTTTNGVEIKLTAGGKDSYQVGAQLAKRLHKDDLVHVFLLSEGIHVNGTQLVKGLTEQLPASVAVTGGLAGDSDRFDQTLVFYDSVPSQDKVVALGLYGDRLKIGFGSMGGWDAFGPNRLITRSQENVLYELDGQSALALYKNYLGEFADDLPASALLFPLSLHTGDDQRSLVRTILGINEEDQSMIFAGDMPEGSFSRLMKANFERLVDGAYGAASASFETLGSSPADLAILISCVGRKMVLKQRVEDEIECVREVLGADTPLTGFYSYGEICPAAPQASCELHNQTMTITTFAER